jgi:hypothetical protein
MVCWQPPPPPKPTGVAAIAAMISQRKKVSHAAATAQEGQKMEAHVEDAVDKVRPRPLGIDTH